MERNKKIVRLLLRVSSNQQLEADGDLKIQRQILEDYVATHPDWILDTEEYFEGSKSAYKNTAQEREVLQKILYDAKNGEFNILVPYKDDRVGRLMLNSSEYVLALKQYNVDVYTVKDGCISPKSLDDIEGMMMLMFRFANAQKSSKDTGLRVKDTAQKLVQQGKFMGGAAPYGYELKPSGQISKHGRALHHLVIVSERADVVRHIYDLSLSKEFGSSKIASILNEDKYYKSLAPKDVWKSGTITSILTNPIYAGYVAYKRRERINGKYHRLDSNDWIKSNAPNIDIQIIDEDTWNRTQEKRKRRSEKYTQLLKHQNITVIKRNDGMLSLIDVAYCGYCGCKLTNGTKYNYWTIKGTGEKRANIIPTYRCQAVREGYEKHNPSQFQAEHIEKIVYDCLSDYITRLQANEDIMAEIEFNQNKECKKIECEIIKLKKEQDKIADKIKVIRTHIPDAMIGNYSLSVDELTSIMHEQQNQEIKIKQQIKAKEESLKQTTVSNKEWEELKTKLPTWKQVFDESDCATHRVLVNKLIERIEIKKEQIIIKFKIDLNEFLPQYRMTTYNGVPESGLQLYNYIFYRL